ncbi:phosphatidyl-myo-inositol alpha-mannosyltransferase [Bifidobacterium pseudolongum subsp. globosum]|uniref:Phosphatidyl-myo-inositol alpha-mannosyltransferase n=1 Tax=Bifidobacterium pseudolongum subsp. globosum TaxID=1690 RepID=A0A2N3QR39_9BIFI|nr:glycosyltransferase family 4 protein [Bifidobacterium pseudolongum]MCH4835456.1 glycosyltransferase family 4 protein [Bifidobacterium pseudolongum]PKU94333.1 phosphatidyl-myo-inositol alpha-mannosyltransferase [Bifidobacterium pseudolongum subsp. globosum]PKU99607.1 phosphatidyl-myo-inositol alpha-mannosyltransferase [Bifidobacterium pseudolongum subsp. globosum]RYQ04628.1 phosphatidyl-myo-inositol alpha-mannosyltransferase [Bifidobacterium pseudolongum subsp. globosum]RYQ09689.1 phosphatid
MALTIGFVFDDTLDALDGVQQHIITIGTELVRRGHDVHYLVGETHHSPVPQTVSLARNVMVSFNGNRMRIPLPVRKREIRAALAHNNYDILHIQAPYSPLFGGRVLECAPQSTGVVATYHIAPIDRRARYGGRALGLVNAHSHRRVDEVIAVSQVAAQYAQFTAHTHGTIIANPVNVEKFATAAHRATRDAAHPHIVFLGRLVPRKGAQLLLDALDYGERHGMFPMPGLHVTIAGEGPLMDDCVQRAARLRTPVQFVGTVDEGKADLLASADVAVFPAIGGETFGIVLPEAIASGAGVTLAGDNPGYRWTMRGDEDALFSVGPDHARVLAERITRALTDAPWARRLHAREEALLDRYNVQAVTDEVEQVYARAIADRRARA